MARRSRTRKVLKWASTTACILFAVAFGITSGRVVKWVSPTHRYEFTLALGSASLMWPSAIWELREGQYEGDTGWSVSKYRWHWWSEWWVEWQGSAYYEFVRIPLWIPFVLCGIPSAALWYGDRQEFKRALDRCGQWVRPMRRGGPRRVVKLGLTAASVVLMVVFIVSLPCALVAQGQSQTLIVGQGKVSWFRLGKLDAPLFAGTGTQPPPTGVHWNESWQPDWGVSVKWFGRPRQLMWVQISIWLPLLLLGVPAAFLWWSERWPSDEARCTGCGYDLTGNVSGRCPECGEAVTRKRDLP